MTHNSGMRPRGKRIRRSLWPLCSRWLRLVRYVKNHRIKSGVFTAIFVVAALLTATESMTNLLHDSDSQVAPETSESPQQTPSLNTTFGVRENRDLYEFLDSHEGESVHLSVLVKSANRPESSIAGVPESWQERPGSIRASRRISASMEIGTAGITEENAIVVLDIDTTPTGVPRCYYPSEENPFDWTIEGGFFVDKTYFQVEQLVVALRPTGN